MSYLFLVTASRMRASACDTVPRLCARPVLCLLAFPSGLRPWLHRLHSGSLRLVRRLPGYYGGVRVFHVRASSAMAPRLPDTDQIGNAQVVGRGVSRFPRMEHACVPGSSTTPGRPSACVGALGHIAFHYTDCGFRRLRPCNPIERGHAFRSKAATFSDEGDRAPLPAW